jgi:hypothetical protein
LKHSRRTPTNTLSQSRRKVGTANPARQVVNAAAEKGKNFPWNIL